MLNDPGAVICAACGGRLPYDSAGITAPTLIIRGEWDTVTGNADARWLYEALSRAPLKCDVRNTSRDAGNAPRGGEGEAPAPLPGMHSETCR